MPKEYFPTVPPALSDTELAAAGVLLGIDGKGAIAWSTVRSRLELWNGNTWIPLNSPKRVLQRVTGIVNIDDVNFNGTIPSGDPNQWLIEPGSSLQPVLVTSNGGDPKAGFWLYRDSSDWERLTGMGPNDLIPNGIVGIIEDGSGVTQEWTVFTTNLESFSHNGIINIITAKKQKLRRVNDVLAVSALNTVSSLTRTPAILSTARLIASSSIHIPTQLDPARGAFTLGGTNNRIVTWNSGDAFPLDPTNFPVVYAEYDILE